MSFKNADEYPGDVATISNRRLWSGGTLCLKRKPNPGEPTGVMGYAAFGVLTNNSLPLVVYIRPNFTQEQHYKTIQAMLDDGWIVD